MEKDVWYVYMIKCVDGSYYTGIAIDVNKRLTAHSSGKGAKYTRGRGPLELVFCEKCGTHSDALKREIQIKKLNHNQKTQLIQK